MSEPNRPTREEVTDWADFTTGPLLERADGKRLCLGYLALLDECDSLRKDKERLDWLEKMPILEKFQVSLSHPNGTKPWWIVKRHWEPEGRGNSVRKAIDAAMESK